jgi:hypothetical protein
MTDNNGLPNCVQLSKWTRTGHYAELIKGGANGKWLIVFWSDNPDAHTDATIRSEHEYPTELCARNAWLETI